MFWAVLPTLTGAENIWHPPVGKKEAEKLIYSVSIIAWLGVPWLPPAAGTSASLLGLANASGKKQFGRLWPDS
jgi:hypothetical protein